MKTTNFHVKSITLAFTLLLSVQFSLFSQISPSSYKSLGQTLLGTNDGNSFNGGIVESSTFMAGHVYFVPEPSNNTVFLQARRFNNSGNGNFSFRTSNNGSLVEALQISNEGNSTFAKGVTVAQPVSTGAGDFTPAFTSVGRLDSYSARAGGGFRFGHGLSAGSNAFTRFDLQLKSQDEWTSVFGIDRDAYSQVTWIFPGDGFVKIPTSYVGIGRSERATVPLEIGAANASATNTHMKVHGGAIFNNDADVTRVTPVAINTNTFAPGAALTVGGATYIGAWKNIEANRNANYLSRYMLWVEKGIVTEDLVFAPKSTWADYVLSKDYNLPELDNVEKFIDENGHLPNVKSAEKVNQEGYDMHEFNTTILSKVEELTLYIIQQNKRIKELERRLENSK